MKNIQQLVFLACFTLLTFKIFSQVPNQRYITPNGVFDKVYDKFGNQYDLQNLDVHSLKSYNGATVSSVAPSLWCTAGYFNIYTAATGTFLNSNSTAANNYLSIICQVFKDVSFFINSNLTTKVNILIDELPSPNLVAAASQFYVFPINPSNPNQGFIQGQVMKALQNGVDPYLNIPMTFSNSTNFFHGIVVINPSLPMFSSLTTNIQSNEYDTYTAILHEVLHLLGFNSLISVSGNSHLFANSNCNMYEKYDNFLYSSQGNKLIVPTNSNIPTSSLVFNTTTLDINPSCPSNMMSTASNCSTACSYSGSAVSKVKTPDCFSNSTSLSHFEDMCTFPNTFTPQIGCTPVPSSPGFNGLYYLMGPKYQGVCGMIRAPKPEERLVLCDIGYSVNIAFVSGSLTQYQVTTTYSSSCAPYNVIGIDDGILNGSYVFTTTTNSIAINYTTILNNDIPANSTVSLQTIYNTATVMPGTSDFTVTASSGSGLAIIKYYPISNGVFGNATYVYIQFVSTNCNPINACSLIQNGGFESFNPTSSQCGQLGVNMPNNSLSCWEPFEGNPSVLTKSCTSLSNNYNLGVNTLGSSPYVMNSFNGQGNNSVIALRYLQVNGANSEVLKNSLSSPLVPNQAYRLSFMYANATGTGIGFNNPANPSPVVLTIAAIQNSQSISSSTYPGTLQVLGQFTLSASNQWNQIVHNFTFNPVPNFNHSAILIGINGPATQALGTLSSTNGVCCYLDELSLIPQNSINFNLPTQTICGNASLLNLSQYGSSIPHDITGPNVLLVNNQFCFNPTNLLLPLGSAYPIAYTYTTGNCVHTLYDWINVSNSQYLQLVGNDICSASSPINFNSLVSAQGLTGTTFSVNNSVVSLPYNLTPGTITLTAQNTSTALCNNSSSLAIVVHSTPTIPDVIQNLVPVTFTDICMGYPCFVNASSSGSVIVWSPNNLTGASQTLSPNISTIYTLSAYNYSGCASSNTFAVQVHTTCCGNQLYAAVSSSAINGYSIYSGPIWFENSFTITPNSNLLLSGADVIFNPSVQVTVAGGGSITLQGSHLHTCNDYLWLGINLVDNSFIQTSGLNTSGMDVLIEDATNAISILNHTTSTRTLIADLNNVIFNKNINNINLTNYQRSSNTYSSVIRLNSCVFTCRELPYTTSAWPKVDISTGMRSASTSTTGASVPYLLGNYSITVVKSPYNRVSSNAIKIVNSGMSSGSNYYGVTIGDNQNSSLFNLFDAHDIFISALNSNLTLVNNVFQNTQAYYYNIQSSSLTPQAYSTGKAAIQFSVNNLMNAKLDLSAPSLDLGNRFWNCHTGIVGYNLYRLNVNNALFRSTQNYTALPGINYSPAGQNGIVLNTNRFAYNIQNSEFTNIANGINVALASGQYTTATTCSNCVIPYGIVASNIFINNNTFSSGTVTNSYMNKAIHISCVNQVTPIISAPSETPTIRSIFIENNKINNPFRGITVNGITAFPVSIKENTIALKTDNVFSLPQKGIELVNTISGGTNSIGQYKINGNTITSNSTNNALATAVFCDNNQGVYSPSVVCNQIASINEGFAFYGPNPHTVWGGNVMQPLNKGLVLNNNGVIGQQGSNTMASANQWAGTWTGSHTDVTNSSSSLSVLWTKNANGYFPLVNTGTNTPDNYAPGNTYFYSTGGDFNCVGLPNLVVVPWPNSEFYSEGNLYDVYKTAGYRMLTLNDSVVNSHSLYSDFLSLYLDSSLNELNQVEQLLGRGEIDSASSLLSRINPSELNIIDFNYKTFYSLYLNFLNSETATLVSADSSRLYALCLLCPSLHGGSIYQARALYNYIYHEAPFYDGCENTGLRKRRSQDDFKVGNQAINESGEFSLFPNPTHQEISIVSSNPTAKIDMVVQDVTGRIVLNKTIVIDNYTTKLLLDLEPGVYLFTLTTNHGSTTTKKIVIEN